MSPTLKPWWNPKPIERDHGRLRSGIVFYEPGGVPVFKDPWGAGLLTLDQSEIDELFQISPEDLTVPSTPGGIERVWSDCRGRFAVMLHSKFVARETLQVEHLLVLCRVFVANGISGSSEREMSAKRPSGNELVDISWKSGCCGAVNFTMSCPNCASILCRMDLPHDYFAPWTRSGADRLARMLRLIGCETIGFKASAIARLPRGVATHVKRSIGGCFLHCSKCRTVSAFVIPALKLSYPEAPRVQGR